MPIGMRSDGKDQQAPAVETSCPSGLKKGSQSRAGPDAATRVVPTASLPHLPHVSLLAASVVACLSYPELQEPSR